MMLGQSLLLELLKALDSPQIVEEVEINPVKETPTDDNVEFYIDEEGIKHYVISARDNPTLGD